MILKINISILLVFCGGSLFAQNLNFSKFQTLAPVMNPALTGFIPAEEDLRISGIYRNQWSNFLGSASYESMGVSFDMRNCFPNSTSNGLGRRRNGNKFSTPTWGLGLSLIHDESGVQSVKDISNQPTTLNRDQVDVSASVIFPLSGKEYLTGGFRFGGFFHRINTAGLRYDEQFDGLAGYDQGISGEFDNVNNLSSNSLNIGGGLSYFYLGGGFGFNGGAAIDYIFLPVEYDFIESDELPVLSRKLTLHAKLSYILSQKKNNTFALNFNSVFMRQNPHQQLIGGVDIVYQNKENVTLALGGGLRTVRSFSSQPSVDAVLTSLTLNFDRTTLMFSYDINVSNLRVASNHYGAYEIGVIYRWKKNNSKCSPVLEGCRLDSKNTHPIFF